MKQIRKRLTYANVMSSIAVFVVLGGAAVAATQLPKKSVGTKQLKANAVKAGKIAKEAVKAAKLANGAVLAGKIADGAVLSGKIANGAVLAEKIANDAVITDKLGNSAVTSGKIANGAVLSDKLGDSAVTTAKLDPSERSQAFAQEASGLTAEIPTGTLGSYSQAISIFTVNLAAGQYVVNAKTEFINASVGNVRYAVCRLLDDAASIDEASATLEPALLAPSGTAPMVGISDGGRLDIACRASGAGVFGFKPKSIAVRVASVG